MPQLLAIVTCVCMLLPAAAQAEVALGADSVFVFASRQVAGEIMAADDAYTSRMSQFDRMLRLKSVSPVSREQYAAHMRGNTLSWTEADRARLNPLLARLANALSGSTLPLPPTVLLIKTTGNEEVGEGHTRANAIALPLHSLDEDDESLFFLLAHELFHIMSRHDARFRQRAYALVGFRIGPELQLPMEIAPLQITNPDAPRHDSFIDVRVEGESMTVVPVLLSRSAVYDPQIGDDLDDYWTLRLMAVAQITGTDALSPLMRDGAPVLFRLNEVTGYIEKVGRNTRYIIHAEEVLAENFAFMATGEIVAEPQRIEQLRQLLTDNDRSAGTMPVESPAIAAGAASQPTPTRRQHHSSASPYCSANRAGWPPVCQNSTVSSLPK